MGKANKKKRVNVLRFAIHKGSFEFSVDGFGYDSFFSSYMNNIDEITIYELYGSDLEREYDLRDVKSIKTLKGLMIFLESKEALVLNTLGLKINDDVKVIIEDNFTLTMQSSSSERLLKSSIPLFDFLGLDESIKKKTFDSPGKYIAINANKQIEALFNTFEDYLKSNYTNEPDTFTKE